MTGIGLVVVIGSLVAAVVVTFVDGGGAPVWSKIGLGLGVAVLVASGLARSKPDDVTKP